jgi:hypothetical protein
MLDKTMVQVRAEVKSTSGQVPIPLFAQDTATLSPLHLTLLKQYFQIAAEVQNLGERLADHNYEYWDAVAMRELKEDQDEVLSIPDKEFEKLHHDERRTITQQLDDAIKEANRMARRDDPGASDEAEYQHIFQDPLDLIPVEAFKNAEIVLGGTPESHSGSEDISKLKAAMSS